MSALDLRRLGRLGGAGLLAGAVALLVLSAIPNWETSAAGVSFVVCLITAVGGLAALRMQWTEDSTKAGEALAAGAYLALGAAGFTGGTQSAYGPLFVVVSAWCGLALGPRHVLRLAPLALVCATLPPLLGRPGSALAGAGAVVVATVTGEIFARLAERVRRDARRDAYRTSALETLTAGQLELARATDASSVGAIAAFVAHDILGNSTQTAVLLERDGRRLEIGSYPPLPPSARAGRPGSPEARFSTFRGTLEVPLSGRGGTGVRGVLAAQPRAGQKLDPFGQALVASLAAATCAALESIALNGRLRMRAEVDPLTGLGNRRRLEAAMERLQPGDLVIVLDLDHFKAVNDTLGHDVGDEVLRAFGEHLSASTRAGELAIRTGGEEFVLLAQGDDPRAAAALLGRLAANWWSSSPLTTFSAGAAVHPGGDPNVTMKRADSALYEAKRRGRAAAWLLPPDPLATGPDGRLQLALDQQLDGRLLPFPGTPFTKVEGRDELAIALPEPAHPVDALLDELRATARNARA